MTAIIASAQSLCYLVLVLKAVNVHSFFADDPSVLEANPRAAKTRGNKFALAFMGNRNDSAPVGTTNQIIIFITTEQESSTFTVQTRFAGVAGRGFNETSPGSGLYSRTENATRGNFTVISLPAGVGGDSDIAVQTNGATGTADRQKGVMIETVDPTHELTVYVFNDEQASTDAYMAINCVEFPTARNYQYFVFSTDYTDGGSFGSRFLITPCDDNTTVNVRPSQPIAHPAWVSPSVAVTDPNSRSTGQDKSQYGRLFNRFDTLMLDANNDLTGSIIISNKPLSVFVGQQCGTPVDVGTYNYLVEQIPPHPTYGDLFLMAPFAVRESGELYRIGSVSDGAQVVITCNCTIDSGSGNRVALQSSTPGVYTATVNRGQYVQCRTPEDTQNYCCVESDRPVTVMGYTLGNSVDKVANLSFNSTGGSAMVYIPPVVSYLDKYSLVLSSEQLGTPYRGFISYILPTTIFNTEDQNNIVIYEEVFLPPVGYTPINCSETEEICAYGVVSDQPEGGVVGVEYDITGAFWGYAYGYARGVFFAYSLPFEMEPVGLATIEAQDLTVGIVQTYTVVTLDFRITRGDRSVRTRAFAYTDGGSATPGVDYIPAGVRPGNGSSNLRWARTRSTPSTPFTVTIISDSLPTAKTIEVRVECEEGENCYSPRAVYTITITDLLCLPVFQIISLPEPCNEPIEDKNPDDDSLPIVIIKCEILSDPANGQVNLTGETVGSTATYTCNATYGLVGSETRVCQRNGTWSGLPATCQLDCGPLHDPENGQVTVTSTVLGSRATYTCDTGYVKAHDAIECQAEVIWNPEKPLCNLIDCGALRHPANGQVTKNDSVLGSVANYSCDPWYSIVGNSSRVCLANQSWSGIEPRCVLESPETVAGIVVAVVMALLLLVLILIVLCVLNHLRRVNGQVPTFGEDSAIFQLSSFNDYRKQSLFFQSQIKEVVGQIPRSLRIPRSHLKMSTGTIGQGEFGIVYKGILINWNDTPVQGVAVKALKGLFTLNDVESMVNEITKMQEFKHPHVLSLIGVCLDTGPGVSMVMPYMTNGSLLDYLRKERSNLEIKEDSPGKILTARRLLLRMCHQIALGMEYLTEQKFIHRDLAARNCMLDSDGNIKVGDFGLAEDVYACGYYRQDKKESVKMPYKWMALESLSDCIFSEKTDMWSYGVTMWEVFSGGQNPYPAVDPMSLTRLLKDGRRLDPPDNAACSDEIFAVMTRCWCENPEERPGFSELCSIMDHLLGFVSDYVELGMVLVKEEPLVHEYDIVYDELESSVEPDAHVTTVAQDD